jgi:hypothetical protein
MKVKKVNGTSDRKCGCGSWLNHWHNYTHQIAQICRAKGCSRKAIDGAHVKICYSTDNREYIIPLCREHNLKNGCFEINKGTDLVSANKILTCKT